MKIAIRPTSEVGVRAGRLLLGERDLESLGVIGVPVRDRDPRIARIEDPSGYDVVISDDQDGALLGEAVSNGLPVVAWVDDGLPDLRNVTVPVLTGANLVSGIGRALLRRELESARKVRASVLAWTEPGTALRHGEPVTFPDPVGARWGRIRHRSGTHTDVVVPLSGDWAGVVVRVDEEARTRILGIADLAVHLEALALTAGAVAVATGAFEPGVSSAADAADAYLLAGLRAGLDVASFTAT